MAAAPQIMEMYWNFEEEDGEQEEAPDFQGGGIYDAEAIRRMDLFSQAPRAGQGLAASLATQRHPGSHLSAVLSTDLFPDMARFKEALSHPAMGFLNSLWRAIQSYGNICSIVVGTGILIRFSTWLGGVILRLFTTPVVGNPVLHVVGAFFPSFRDFLRDPNGCCWRCFGAGRHQYQSPTFQRNMTEEEMDEQIQLQDRLVTLYANRTADKLAERMKSPDGSPLDKAEVTAALKQGVTANPYPELNIPNLGIPVDRLPSAPGGS